jgi:hypothetical protein
MTKDELKKEATEYALEWGDKTDGTYACCRDGYLAGAEPREKRIAELEKENAELKTKANALENANKAMVKELDDMTSGGISVLKNVVRSKEQLVQAKEILRGLYFIVQSRIDYENNTGIADEMWRAEQFLKEVDKYGV